MSAFITLLKNHIPPKKLIFERLHGDIGNGKAFQVFKVRLTAKETNNSFPKLPELLEIEDAYKGLMLDMGVIVDFDPTTEETMLKRIGTISNACIFKPQGIEGHYGNRMKEGKVVFTPLARAGMVPFRVSLKDLTQKKS